MTPEDRTKKLFLDIICAHDKHPDEFQHSAEDVQWRLASGGITMTLDSVHTTLRDLLHSGFVNCLLCGRYRITASGRQQLLELANQATQECLDESIERPRPFVTVNPGEKDVVFQVQVSEAALDAWWMGNDIEIKAELFNRFYEPMAKQEDDPEAA